MYTAPFELSVLAAILSLTRAGSRPPSLAPIALANSSHNARPINNIHTLAARTAEIAHNIHPSAAPTPLFSVHRQGNASRLSSTSHFVSTSSALLRLFSPLFRENIPSFHRVTHSCAKNPGVGKVCIMLTLCVPPLRLQLARPLIHTDTLQRTTSNADALQLRHPVRFRSALFSLGSLFAPPLLSFQQLLSTLAKKGGIPPSQKAVAMTSKSLYWARWL